MTPGRFTKAYFEKWYRHPRHRVITTAMFARKAQLAVSVAEYYLGRRIRNALDIGCGEGQWQPALKKLRPRIRYTGIDPSPYAVKRFGRHRNLIPGSFGNLPALAVAYDLIIASDSLYYVPEDELIAGFAVLVPRLAGVAFLEAYASDAALDGDTAGMFSRSTAVYRRIFRNAGLRSCGSHCYVGPPLYDPVTEMELGGR